MTQTSNQSEQTQSDSSLTERALSEEPVRCLSYCLAPAHSNALGALLKETENVWNHEATSQTFDMAAFTDFLACLDSVLAKGGRLTAEETMDFVGKKMLTRSSTAPTQVVLTKLLDAGALCGAARDETGNSLLHQYALSYEQNDPALNNAVASKKTFEALADIVCIDFRNYKEWMTPVMVLVKNAVNGADRQTAVDRQHLAYFLSAQPKVEISDREGNSLLHFAAQANNKGYTWLFSKLFSGMKATVDIYLRRSDKLATDPQVVKMLSDDRFLEAMSAHPDVAPMKALYDVLPDYVRQDYTINRLNNLSLNRGYRLAVAHWRDRQAKARSEWHSPYDTMMQIREANSRGDW